VEPGPSLDRALLARIGDVIDLLQMTHAPSQADRATISNSVEQIAEMWSYYSTERSHKAQTLWQD